MSCKILNDVILFGADSARSRAYLSLMKRSGLLPSKCILFHPLNAQKKQVPEATNFFDNITPLAEAVKKANIPLVEVSANDINEPEVVSSIKKCTQTIIIFSGPAGALVKKSLFSTEKSFIHVHPGKLPHYRGSTTMYYSLLAERKIWVSALVLSPIIDQGPIIDKMEIELPNDPLILDQIYDPYMRAQMMTKVFQEYSESGTFSKTHQQRSDDPTLFVIHPVLKHIAILSLEDKIDDENI